jgi:hypothetical protein
VLVMAPAVFYSITSSALIKDVEPVKPLYPQPVDTSFEDKGLQGGKISVAAVFNPSRWVRKMKRLKKAVVDLETSKRNESAPELPDDWQVSA